MYQLRNAIAKIHLPSQPSPPPPSFLAYLGSFGDDFLPPTTDPDGLQFRVG